jgi:hypothetical protein
MTNVISSNSTTPKLSLYTTEQTSKAAPEKTPTKPTTPAATSDTVTISTEAKALFDNSTTIQPMSAGGTQLPPIPEK